MDDAIKELFVDGRHFDDGPNDMKMESVLTINEAKRTFVSSSKKIYVYAEGYKLFEGKRTLANFLKSTCIPDNLKIIKKECDESSLRSSLSLMYAIRSSYGEYASKLDKLRTSFTSLKFLLLKEMTSCKLGITRITEYDRDGLFKVMYILGFTEKLIRLMFATRPLTERQAFSDIRHHVIKNNFSPLMVDLVKQHGGFAQLQEKKDDAEEQQTTARDKRIVKQTLIDVNEAIDVGRTLVSISRRIMEYDSGIEYIHEMLYTLVATVMYATGARLIEVVFLSNFTDSDTVPHQINIRPGSDVLWLHPVAKTRDGGSKGSHRVILFGLQSFEIGKMVERIRILMGLIDDNYKSMKKDSIQDRMAVIRKLNGFGKDIEEEFMTLNPSHRFIPRDLRALYVSLSYMLWAKHPTSEIMWINHILGHADINTSLSYNKFTLTGNGLGGFSYRGIKSNRITVIEKRLRKLEDLLQPIKI